MYLFLIHCLVLILLSFGAARHLTKQPIDRLLATILLAWGNIVASSLLLSCLHRLGEPDWFLRTSLAIALVLWLLLRRSGLDLAPEPPPSPGSRVSPLLLIAFIVTLGPIAFASIRIASTYVPNNYDSLAYHLPRAMFYLGQNTLAHFDTGNARQIYFPFNYNLLQLFALIYSPPLQCLTFINLAAWAGAGLAIFRLCRLCAFSANSALVTVWLALTSTQVLAQGTATTNDLPTATALLAALVFIFRWRHHRRSSDAWLGALGVGLAAGTKLTIVFFFPAAGLIVLALVYQHWRRGELVAGLHGVRAWLLPGMLALGLAAPFAAINLAEKGEWVSTRYDYTLNRPFSLACVAQTSEAYLVQLFVEPLHRFKFDAKFTENLNSWGKDFFFPHWNEAFAFSPLYLFPPDLNEDHVWFGFTGPFILLCAIYCVSRWRKFTVATVWLAGLGLGWIATYFLLNKWSLYNQRYLVPAILVMSPAVAGLLEHGWANLRLRRFIGIAVVLLAGSAVWMAGIYLFQNTSRPYAPLWAGTEPPPALPILPPIMVERMSTQSRINIDTTDGNERTFLLMTFGRQQKFTAFDRLVPGAYNVFSEWGWPRKLAYSNIEQLSSYTVVAVPGKRTAGIESLGTIGSGQSALDYYGLVPNADQVASSDADRKVLVVLYYRPRDPGRYSQMRLKVVGLNAPDQARLIVGVEYADRSTEDLATFHASGEAPASVTKAFRRFTVRVENEITGEKMGAIDIPYLIRESSSDVEAPHDPTMLFSDELVGNDLRPHILIEGLAPPEGPYPQWSLPLIRWAKAPVVRLEIPATEQLGQLEVAFSVRLEARPSALLDVLFNGRLMRTYQLDGRTNWLNQNLHLTPQPGANVLEFRNVTTDAAPDWLEYLDRYPDVKAYLLAQNTPLEQGAQEHFENHGRREGRTVNFHHLTETLDESAQFYYVFGSLRVNGFRIP